MREIIQLDLAYRKKGKVGEKLIKIEFICNEATNLYRQLSKTVLEVTNLSNGSTEIDKQLGLLRAKEEKNRQDDIKILELNAESKEISISIEKYLDTDFFYKRLELILLIMEGNPSDDPDLTDRNFWNKCVEPVQMRMFIDEAIKKDYLYAKKKAVKKVKKRRFMKKG